MYKALRRSLRRSGQSHRCEDASSAPSPTGLGCDPLKKDTVAVLVFSATRPERSRHPLNTSITSHVHTPSVLNSISTARVRKLRSDYVECFERLNHTPCNDLFQQHSHFNRAPGRHTCVLRAIAGLELEKGLWLKTNEALILSCQGLAQDPDSKCYF